LVTLAGCVKTCDTILVGTINGMVVKSKCESCPAGKTTNDAGNDASGHFVDKAGSVSLGMGNVS